MYLNPLCKVPTRASFPGMVHLSHPHPNTTSPGHLQIAPHRGVRGVLSMCGIEDPVGGGSDAPSMEDSHMSSQFRYGRSP